MWEAGAGSPGELSRRRRWRRGDGRKGEEGRGRGAHPGRGGGEGEGEEGEGDREGGGPREGKGKKGGSEEDGEQRREKGEGRERKSVKDRWTGAEIRLSLACAQGSPRLLSRPRGPTGQGLGRTPRLLPAAPVFSSGHRAANAKGRLQSKDAQSALCPLPPNALTLLFKGPQGSP